jgi:hypothetical protein
MERRGFIFTIDAFLMLPLVILIIASFLVLSSTLNEYIMAHEFAYLTARDTMTYMSELTVDGAYSQLAALVGPSDRGMTIAQLITRRITSGNVSGAAEVFNRTISLPETAGYVFEYSLDGAAWNTISERQKPRYHYQVSDIRVVTALSNSTLTAHSDCIGEVVCALSPTQLYTKGEIYGPLMLRMRVYV